MLLIPMGSHLWHLPVTMPAEETVSELLKNRLIFRRVATPNKDVYYPMHYLMSILKNSDKIIDKLNLYIQPGSYKTIPTAA